MTKHSAAYAAVATAAATLIKAVEVEQAVRASLPPEAVTLPALPAAMHELADPLGEIGDWLAALEAIGLIPGPQQTGRSLTPCC